MGKTRDKAAAAADVLFLSALEWARAHKGRMLAFLIFEAWVHSLVFSHLTELRQLAEVIPFHRFFGQ